VGIPYVYIPGSVYMLYIARLVKTGGGGVGGLTEQELVTDNR